MELNHNLLPPSVQRDLIQVGTAAMIVRKTEPFDEKRYSELMSQMDWIIARAKKKYPAYFWTDKEAYERRTKREANDPVFDRRDAA
jgi:hypothetical protein